MTELVKKIVAWVEAEPLLTLVRALPPIRSTQRYVTPTYVTNVVAIPKDNEIATLGALNSRLFSSLVFPEGYAHKFACRSGGSSFYYWPEIAYQETVGTYQIYDAEKITDDAFAVYARDALPHASKNEPEAIVHTVYLRIYLNASYAETAIRDTFLLGTSRAII